MNTMGGLQELHLSNFLRAYNITWMAQSHAILKEGLIYIRQNDKCWKFLTFFLIFPPGRRLTSSFLDVEEPDPTKGTEMLRTEFNFNMQRGKMEVDKMKSKKQKKIQI